MPRKPYRELIKQLNHEGAYIKIGPSQIALNPILEELRDHPVFLWNSIQGSLSIGWYRFAAKTLARLVVALPKWCAGFLYYKTCKLRETLFRFFRIGSRPSSHNEDTQ